jgi:hypothetical protein
MPTTASTPAGGFSHSSGKPDIIEMSAFLLTDLLSLLC